LDKHLENTSPVPNVYFRIHFQSCDGADTTWIASDPDPVWTDIVEHGKLVRRETSIALSTPGSVFSVLQATLPFILFRSQPADATSLVPLRVTIHGGTNVWHSMSYEWAEHVLFPLLHAKLGIGPITMELHKRSWSTGPTSIGSVTFTIPPLPSASPLLAFSFTDRGALSKIAIFIFAPNPTWQTALLDTTQSILTQRFPDTTQEVILHACISCLSHIRTMAIG
jgi:RNA 3'-terminal phosphate cyclase